MDPLPSQEQDHNSPTGANRRKEARQQEWQSHKRQERIDNHNKRLNSIIEDNRPKNSLLKNIKSTFGWIITTLGLIWCLTGSIKIIGAFTTHNEPFVLFIKGAATLILAWGAIKLGRHLRDFKSKT